MDGAEWLTCRPLNTLFFSPSQRKEDKTFIQMLNTYGNRGHPCRSPLRGKEAINYFIDTNHDAKGADTSFDKINNPIGEA